jgi:RNA polymerase sigma-70 factor (ECF subfamily)
LSGLGHVDDWSRWIDEARRGSREALGQLLEKCRNYLLVVARGALGEQLHAKAGSSDLVQETFMQAQRNFARFTGTSEAELLAWLRGILLNSAADFSRRFQETDKRQVGREVPLDEARQQAPSELTAALPSPSEALMAGEQDAALRRALDELPEDYRTVIQLRNYGQLSFEEIGKQLGRSADAARKLWARALKKLQQILDRSDAAD